jgi:guanine nucleotide-binding protein alpha-1 subunit
MFRLPARFCTFTILCGAPHLESCYPAECYPVRCCFVIKSAHLKFCRNIKRILEVLTEEWESTANVASNTRNLQRIRLGLSPLLFIETNLSKMLSPEEIASRHRDVCVRPNSDWKSLLRSRRASPSRAASPHERSRRTPDGTDPTSALAALKDDIIMLWEDPSVQEVLKRREVRLEDTAGL